MCASSWCRRTGRASETVAAFGSRRSLPSLAHAGDWHGGEEEEEGDEEEDLFKANAVN